MSALIDYDFQRNALRIFCVHGYTKITLTISEGRTTVLPKIQFFSDVIHSWANKQVNQSRYSPGGAQRVPGS